jgi:nitric oxide reductase NorQ protein
MYFIKTEQVGGKPRLRPLSNQKFPTGESVNALLYVSGSESKRHENVIGTVFAVDHLELVSGYYKATPTDIIPVTGINAKDPTYIAAYESFLDGVAPNAGDPAKASKPAPSVPKPRTTKTTLETLLERYPVPTINNQGYYVTKNAWESLLLQISAKENTLLTGPTGTAKTEIVALLAEMYGKELVILDMSAQQDPVSGMLGVHRLDAKGASYFDYAKFARKIQEPNVWFLFDELNRAPAAASNIIFPLTDFRRILEVSIASSSGLTDIPVHSDVVFFATANLGSEYSGTNQVDRALRDRFSEVELAYPPAPREAEILNNRVSLSLTECIKIATHMEKLRTAKDSGDVSVSPSVRHSIRIASRVKKGMQLRGAFESVVMPLYEHEERETIKTILGAM